MCCKWCKCRCFSCPTVNLLFERSRRWNFLCVLSPPVWWKCADQQISFLWVISVERVGVLASVGTLISALSIAAQSPWLLFPSSHCPFDDVLGKAKRPGSSWHYSVKELGRFLFFSLSKDEKAKGLDLIEGPQQERDWESCSSAFKSNCSSRRRGKMRLERNTWGAVKAVGCVCNKIGLREEEKEWGTETVMESQKMGINNDGEEVNSVKFFQM